MTLKSLLLSMILCLGFALPVGAATPLLTPLPSQITEGEGHFTLTAQTRIYIPAGDLAARNAAVYLRDKIRQSRGLTLTIVSGAAPENTPAIVFTRIQTFVAEDAESYHLTVAAEGVTIAAAAPKGLFYGAVTAWQLATQEAGKGATRMSAVAIFDTPRFKWRGLMLDSARHFQPPAEVKKLIDAMATQKLNILQWHLTDDQGWRLEIKAYPRLTQVSAWRQEAGAAGVDKHGRPIRYGGFYTQDQLRDIIAYAAARNITIVPEIDIPGHATAIIKAYPSLGTQGVAPQERMSDWGVYPNLLSPEDATFAFLDTVYDEVMDLFPSPYIHVGGDEAIKPQWQASPTVQARIKSLGLKDEHELQAWFIARVGRHLAARGRRLIGWDEILEGGIAPDATVMSWRGIDGAVTAAKLGHDTILSPSPQMYFDHRQSVFSDEPPGRGVPTTLKTVYDFNPALDAMTPAERQHVLGLQANLWTEHIRTDVRVEAMAFPRLLAVAEIGWSPAASHDWDDFVRRLPADLKRLDTLGIGYNTVPFEPHATLTASGDGISVSLANGLGIGDIHVDGKPYSGPITVSRDTTVTVQTLLDGQPLGRARRVPITRAALETRDSYQLDMCQGKLNLALEDDGGDRGVVLMDILKPCWIWRAADTSKGLAMSARVANYPFNFQLGNRPDPIKFEIPQTPSGELVVHIDTCDGPVAARLPLDAAAKSTGVTVLTGQIAAQSGAHDLCFLFAQSAPPPEWALKDVRLTPQ